MGIEVKLQKLKENYEKINYSKKSVKFSSENIKPKLKIEQGSSDEEETSRQYIKEPEPESRNYKDKNRYIPSLRELIENNEDVKSVIEKISKKNQHLKHMLNQPVQIIQDYDESEPGFLQLFPQISFDMNQPKNKNSIEFLNEKKNKQISKFLNENNNTPKSLESKYDSVNSPSFGKIAGSRSG